MIVIRNTLYIQKVFILKYVQHKLPLVLQLLFVWVTFICRKVTFQHDIFYSSMSIWCFYSTDYIHNLLQDVYFILSTFNIIYFFNNRTFYSSIIPMGDFHFYQSNILTYLLLLLKYNFVVLIATQVTIWAQNHHFDKKSLFNFWIISVSPEQILHLKNNTRSTF